MRISDWSSDVCSSDLATSLLVDTSDGAWRRGLEAAAVELRRALEFGFSDAEVAEQVARIRSSLENAARSSATQTNNALVAAALGLIDDARKSVVSGKRVEVRLARGGRRIIKKK